MNVVWSPEAEDDLTEALDYIEYELGSPIAAARLYDAIKAKIDLIAAVPGSSVILKRNGIPSGYCYTIAGSFMVFVMYSENEMRVVRILYGKSDYMRILFE